MIGVLKRLLPVIPLTLLPVQKRVKNRIRNSPALGVFDFNKNISKKQREGRLMPIYEIIIRLALSCFLGGLIGLERESLNRPAGLRTYTLVCMGAALVMMVSKFGFTDQAGWQSLALDPSRIAAQVVSGIGFLGAGTILREGPTIKGLTTAAGLWLVAGVGLAVGAGLYLAAAVTTGMALLVLVYFFKVEEKFQGAREFKHFTVFVQDRPGQIGRVGTALGDIGVHIKNLTLSHPEGDLLVLDLMLRIPPQTRPQVITDHLLEVEGVFKVEHQD
jgi:putative Mg2+ transporter-C (MgtC) family protein